MATHSISSIMEADVEGLSSESSMLISWVILVTILVGGGCVLRISWRLR